MQYNFEHPEIICCEHCPCGHGEYNEFWLESLTYCKLAKKELKGAIYGGSDIPEWCPLIPSEPTYKDIAKKFGFDLRQLEESDE